MATVNVMKNKRTQSRAGLAFILSYCKRESKTVHEGRKLVSGVNCLPESAYQEFMNTKLQYGKTDGRMFYHFTQSFSPTENITPETAHEIAVKFAEKMFPGFEVLVATHTDKAHTHSHFVVNSVSCENGYKYHSDNENIERLRAESDKLCLQYGLSVLPPKEQSQKVKQMSSREYRAAERGESWKMQLIVTIEDAMAIARSREHFIRLMEAEGYEVKWTRDRKSITYTTPDGKRCRDNKLHEEKFLKENMEYEFRIRNEIQYRIKGYSESAYEESGNRRPLYSSDGREPEGSDRRDEYADRLLAAIQKSLTELATKEELTSYMERQIEILTEYAESSRELTEQFTEMMERTVTASTERMSTATENMSSQVGKASEQFSQSLSSERETVRTFTKRSIWISLIPTAVLIIWELIRHIFLLT